jgi:predicted NBD/HSP70 family sugar kinase
MVANGNKPTLHDLLRAVEQRDPQAVEAIERSSHEVGKVIAALVTFENPSMVILGGQLIAGNDDYIAGVRETIFAHALPLAARELRVEQASVFDAGLYGAAHMVLDELFGIELIEEWLTPDRLGAANSVPAPLTG